VNGGGWIDVQPNVCAMSPECVNAAGKVTFGFTVKHKVDDPVPTGNVQFQFRDGDISFHAEQLSGLFVVEPLAFVNGYGRVNGVSGYRFRMVVEDGGNGNSDDRIDIEISDSDDRIGIEIFDSDDDLVFRSSGLGSALSTLPLQGGSLKVDCQGAATSCGNIASAGEIF